MAELIEEYLHSREIQLKREAETKPKIKSVSELVNNMFYCGTTPPENPKQGDMYLDLTSGHSVCNVYDGERFVVVGAAYRDPAASIIPAGYPYERSYHNEQPMISARALSEEQIREFREGIEREWSTTTIAGRLIEPGIISEMDLPTQRIVMGTPIIAETIRAIPATNRNGDRYIGIDYDSMASHNHNISVEHVPADGIMRTGYALPADGVMRTSHLEGVGARRTRSISGTLNGPINMDVFRSLIGGE